MAGVTVVGDWHEHKMINGVTGIMGLVAGGRGRGQRSCRQKKGFVCASQGLES